MSDFPSLTVTPDFSAFFIIRLILVDFNFEEIIWEGMHIPFASLFAGIPLISFMLIYFIVSEQSASTTLGKRLLNLKVVDESGIKITWTQSFIRNVTKVPFLTTFLGFDVLFGIISEKTRGRKQRSLDFVAGTIVIKQS